MAKPASSNDRIELYVHSEGNEDPELLVVEQTALVRSLLVDPSGHEQIWLDEQEEPVDLDVALKAADIRHRDHVHRGRCRSVHVEVRFNNDRVRHELRQVAKIRRVFEWASGDEGFNLPAEQRAKHVLALPGADHFLDWNVHLGSLVTGGSCRVVLDLLPRERFEG